MPLGNAENDAREFGQLLTTSPYDFNVQTLIGEKATRQAMLEALFKLRETEPDDRILFYFAGHGYTLTNRRGHETGYLACVDTLPEKDFTAIELDSVTALRDHAGAKHICFIFDACFSGQALGLTRAPSVAANKLLECRAYQVMSAGAADQTVSDYQSMTRSLLQELRAGPNKLEMLTLNSLGLRVQQIIAADSKNKQIPQFGHLTYSQGGDFVFVQHLVKPSSDIPKQDFKKTASYKPGSLTETVLGQYKIEGHVGRGDMADVYLGRMSHIKRYVAIKILPREFLHDDTFHERFGREMRSVAKLDHSRIVPVYDYGIDDMPYIVMRYLSGGSLADLCSHETSVKPDTVVQILTQISEGLDYAHEQGVIHRDIKPSNILRDEEDNYFIVDFGIIKISKMTAQLTGSGIVGTPAYMAPEYAKPGSLTKAVDIYALGVTVFQLLTGQLPYTSATPMGILIQHTNSPVPDIRKKDPGFSEDVAKAVMKAMAKTPEERFSTAGEFSSALSTAFK